MPSEFFWHGRSLPSSTVTESAVPLARVAYRTETSKSPLVGAKTVYLSHSPASEIIQINRRHYYKHEH